jgi:multiple sugar transport system permease protein
MTDLSLNSLNRRPRKLGRYDGLAADDPRLFARRRRIMVNGVVTGFALVLLLVYLLPLGYGGVTSLKTKSQASEANSPILPTEVITFQWEGSTYGVYEVPFEDGEVRDLALV